MKMPSLFLETKAFQLVTGAASLIVGAVVMPIMAGILLKLVTGLNTSVFATTYAWQGMFDAVWKLVVTIFCVALAAYGAILLVLAAAVSARLIKSPWE